jgi:uncharacterized protein (UPF0147 family)
MTEDDPRWRKVREFFIWLDASKDALANEDVLTTEEFLQRFSDYEAALEDIAGDVSVSSAERSAAQSILDDMAADARMHTADAAQALAEVAADEDVDDHDRRNARGFLKWLDDRLHAEGSDISRWISAPTERPQ